MGSAVSAQFPAEFKDSIASIEKSRLAIAKYDAEFIHKQAHQTWKNHKLIIEALTSRTKSQLQMAALIYQKAENDGGYNTPVDIEVRDMLGGNYGDFLRLLILSRADMDVELLQSALNSLGCDENLLGDVFCTASNAEIENAQKAWSNKFNSNLSDKITGKTLPGSSFQKFILGVLSQQRSEDGIVNENDAITQAEAIHKAGIGSHKDEDTIFSILLKISREQCAAISKVFETKYSMTLHKAIHTAFAGSLARALVLWTSTIPDSIATLYFLAMNSPVVNMEEISHLTARYSKLILNQIANVYETKFEDNLIQKLSTSLNGNFKKAIIAWLTSPSYDNGSEDKIMDMIANHKNSMAEILADKSLCDELFNILTEQEKTLTIMIDKLPDLNEDSSTRNKSLPKGSNHGEKTMEVSPSTASLRDVNVDASAVPEVLAEMGTVSHRKDISYDEKFKIVCDYLRERFQQDDIDNSGALSHEEFRNTLKRLDVGYTDDEILGIQDWVDWDKDGVITYDEVINELADSVLSAIENLGLDVADKIAELIKWHEEENARLWAEYEAWELQQNPAAAAETLPPDLATFLQDTFDAYDVDHDKMLNDSEFWEMMVSTLGLLDGDMAALKVRAINISYMCISMCKLNNECDICHDV
jgi:hypothetical protein